MSIDITVALIGLLGAFCGMLISIFVVRYMLKISARHKFAAAFTDELAVLKSGIVGDECATLQMFEASFEKHNRAYVERWSVLGKCQKRRLEKKWNKFCHGDRDLNPDDRFTYLASNAYEEKESIKTAIKNIESLIST